MKLPAVAAILNHSNNNNNAASSYISTSHQESPEKLQTRPGWTRRTRCVHPAERQRGRGGEPLQHRYDVLDAFAWKWGQTSRSKLLAIFALHLVLSWGRNMSPVVISETDALRLYRASKYQTNIPKLLWSQSICPIFTIICLKYVWKFPIPFQPLTSNGLSGGNSCPYGKLSILYCPKCTQRSGTHLMLENSPLKLKRSQRSKWETGTKEHLNKL